MEHITDRGALQRLARRLRLRDDWHEPDEQNVTARVRGRRLDNAGLWGVKAEGEAAVGLVKRDSLELYVIISLGGLPFAEVNLADALAWAATDNPTLTDKIAKLEANCRNLRTALGQQEIIFRTALPETDPGAMYDPVLTWPLYNEYEDASNCAEYKTLRCMADVPTGKLGAFGNPQGRSCRAEIDGDNILEQITALRLHIAAVEHLPGENGEARSWS